MKVKKRMKEHEGRTYTNNLPVEDTPRPSSSTIGRGSCGGRGSQHDEEGEG